MRRKPVPPLRGGALAVAGLTALFLLVCAGSGVTARGGDRPGAAAGQERSGLAPVPEVEHLLSELAALSGHPAAGPMPVVFHGDPGTWLVWTTRAGETCLGTYTRSYDGGRGEVACPPSDAGTDESDGSATLRAVTRSAELPGYRDWVLLYFTDVEELTGVSCGDTPLTLTRVAELPVAGRTRTFYTVAAPWLPYGTLVFDVRREGAPAIERIRTGAGIDWSGREYARVCE
ncbi:hypothetical protein ACFVVX_37545 [Kitasatospora sp. NPDC058170]|uniref:hypothetical protein n=1 Tax=Kitasatospora sp. NPDC058170 TaxID=3346364 RepID=UPI0036DB1724